MGIFNKLLGAIGKVAPALPGVGVLRAFDTSAADADIRKQLEEQRKRNLGEGDPTPLGGGVAPQNSSAVPLGGRVLPPNTLNENNPALSVMPSAVSQDATAQRTFETLPTNPTSPSDLQKMAPSPVIPPKPIGGTVQPIKSISPSEAFMKILNKFSGKGEEITAPQVPLGTTVTPRPPVLEFDPNAAPYRFSLNPEDETANQPIGFKENAAPLGPAVAPPTTGATTTQEQPRFGQIPAGPFGVSPMAVQREPLLPKPTTVTGQQQPFTVTPTDLNRIRQDAVKQQFGLGGADIRQPGALYERFQQQRAAAQAAQNRVKVPFQGKNAYIENGVVYDVNGNRLSSLGEAIKDSKFYRDLQLSSLNPQLEAAAARGDWDTVNRLKTAIARAEYEYAQNPTPDKKRGIRDFLKAAGLGALKGFITGGPAGAVGGAFGGGVASIINPNADEQLMGELFTIPRAKRRYEQAAATELATSEAQKKAAEAERASIETEIKRGELMGLPYKTLQEKAKAKGEWLKNFKGGNGPYSEAELQEMDRQSIEMFGEPTYLEPGRYYGTGGTRTFNRETGQVIITTPQGDAVPVYMFDANGTRTPLFDMTQAEVTIYDPTTGKAVGAMTSEDYVKFQAQSAAERQRVITQMERENRKQAETMISGLKTTVKTATARRLTALTRQGQLQAEYDSILLQINGGTTPSGVVKGIEQLKAEATWDNLNNRPTDMSQLDSNQIKALQAVEVKERQLQADAARLRGEIQNQQNIIDGADADIQGATESIQEILGGLQAQSNEGATTGAQSKSGFQTPAPGAAQHGELSTPDAKGYKYGVGAVTATDGSSSYDGDVLVDADNQVWAHGEGTRTYKDGATLTGTFTNGKADGAGVYTFADKSKYEGNFKADKREGKGKLTYPDGTTFEGTFKKDVPTEGTITFADGSKYVGKVNAKGLADGEGELFDRAGNSVSKGKFKDGTLVTPSTVAVAPK